MPQAYGFPSPESNMSAKSGHDDHSRHRFRRDQPRLRDYWFSEYVSKDALPPKHPAIHRSPEVKAKHVAFWDTDSTDTQSSYDVRTPYSRNSWSCESDSKDQFLVSRKFPEISCSPKIAKENTWDPDQCSQSSGNSTFCESDSKNEIRALPKFPGVHRSSKTKQQRVSWEIDLINDVKSALKDLRIYSASPTSSCGEFVSRDVDLNDETEYSKSSQSSKYFDDSEPKEVVLTPQSFLKNHQFPESDQKKLVHEESERRQTVDDDVRKIVDGILKELRPPQSERSLSCSSSCSGSCLSCCYSSCSNLGTWTPRPSTPAVDIPKFRPTPAVLARIHGNTPTSDSPRESWCNCSQCTRIKNPVNLPPVLTPSSWITNSFCSQCLPPFGKDSLDSKISIDSLNHQSIFSLDSLNSLTDPDSLEYSKTNVSIDSLDSLDSCCNDSLSDSKDSGFFSCSLPVGSMLNKCIDFSATIPPKFA